MFIKTINKAGLLFWIAFITAPVLFTMASWYATQNKVFSPQERATTVARIIDSNSTFNKDCTTHCPIKISFQADSRTIQSTISTKRLQYLKLIQSAEFPVFYAPKNPNNFELFPAYSKQTLTLLNFASLVVFCLLVFGFARSWLYQNKLRPQS